MEALKKIGQLALKFYRRSAEKLVGEKIYEPNDRISLKLKSGRTIEGTLNSVDSVCEDIEIIIDGHRYSDSSFKGNFDIDRGKLKVNYRIF